MAALTYSDAMGEALHRLEHVGFEHGPSFVNHAPMAAEAMAHLGFSDEVPAWVDRNLRTRRYHAAPERRWPISADDEADWRSALGDFRRVADWSAMFERLLAEQPWRQVLARWWPRLLPGMSGALTHGVIRTAHAVRAIASAETGDGPQRQELARALGYWSARYSGPTSVVDDGPIAPSPAGSGTAARERQAMPALDRLVAGNAGYYASERPGFPVPLIHTITAPAAVRLVCAYLPENQHRASCLVARRCVEEIWCRFGPGSALGRAVEGAPRSTPATPAADAGLMAAALELGDEHAIKLAEVTLRHQALLPDDRCARAAHWAIRQIARNPV